MRQLRILFVVRPDSGVRIGGDAVQAFSTAAELRNLGHTVDIAAAAQPDARGYDIAHIFGIFDPPLAASQIAACRASGVPVALSPIWWDLTDFFARSRAVEKTLGGRERTIERDLRRIRERRADELAGRRERERARTRARLQRELMLQAAALLPNSVIEAHRYLTDLHLQHPLIHVVPNAASDDSATAGPPGALRSGVLCAGRVESRKNQAMLLYALRDVDVAVTLAGECYDAYYRKLCGRWNPRVTFAGPLPRDRVLELMRGALVHALPAWLETPGIASLEAARAGCAIVSGNRASEFEYFRETAWYCDPGDPESIRNAVTGALAAARTQPLRSARQAATFTWAHAAAQTQAAYEQMI